MEKEYYEIEPLRYIVNGKEYSYKEILKKADPEHIRIDRYSKEFSDWCAVSEDEELEDDYVIKLSGVPNALFESTMDGVIAQLLEWRPEYFGFSEDVTVSTTGGVGKKVSKEDLDNYVSALPYPFGGDMNG